MFYGNVPPLLGKWFRHFKESWCLHLQSQAAHEEKSGFNPEDEGTMILGNQWNQQHTIISQNTQVISNTTVRTSDLTLHGVPVVRTPL